MIRTRLSFKVYGATEAEIRRRAVSQVNEFLELSDDSTSNSYDMEIDVVEIDSQSGPTYSGDVLVKVKH